MLLMEGLRLVSQNVLNLHISMSRKQMMMRQTSSVDEKVGREDQYELDYLPYE
jgi:hypothetical protein